MKISPAKIDEAARAIERAWSDGSANTDTLPPLEFMPQESEHLARAAVIALGMEVEE